MTTNNPLKVALAAAAMAVMPLTAEATLMRAIPFDEKVETSESIVVGRCVRQETRWDASNRWILTYSTFRVEKALKGQPSAEITVVTPGGTVNGETQATAGIPDFNIGEDNVVFVRHTAAGPTVAYFDQGAYDVVQEGNERIVKPVATDAVMLDTQRGVAAPAEEPRPLREFEQLVRKSDERARFNRMKMVEQKQKQEQSLVSVLQRNKLLVLLALAGALLATWQILRRSS